MRLMIPIQSNAIDKTKKQAVIDGKTNKFGNPSYELVWNVENCAEVWSVRQAIMNGSDWDDIVFKCIDIKTNEYKSPCLNCQTTFEELKNLGGK